MPSTETKNPKSIAMMKAFVLLSTIWFGFVSLDLPNVNTPLNEGGKFIKAKQISSCHFYPPDSNTFVIVPEFRFTDPSNYRISTVVIDPGHGGHDPGCLGHNSREKHIVLAIGNYLAAGLKAQFPGLNVIMTRSTDVFVPLHKRASIATDNKADLFISIHCNAFSKSHANGIETYVLGLHATNENLEVAKRENEAILLEDNYKENYGYDPNSPEAHILFSMFQNAFLEQSISFAEKVQGQAHIQTDRKDRGVKQAGFLVLRYATMPSVLVETGYLTNSADEAFLMTDAGQRKMANSIQDAFAEYKREMERTGPETAATVSYIEVKKPNLIRKTPSTITARPTQKEEAPANNKIQKTSTTSLDEHQIAETEKAKKWGLEIAPPNNYNPSTNNTNTSPKRNSKISPTQPVNGPTLPTVNEEAPIKFPDHELKTATEKREAIAEKKVVERDAKKIEPVNKKSSPNIQFCVQLAASPSTINVRTGKWTRITQTVEVIKEAGLYKYQVRNFATIEEAKKVRYALQSKGFADAFVVAYKDGKRVDPRKL